jgi:nucleoside-diphosphate-sugar epimerase
VNSYQGVPVAIIGGFGFIGVNLTMRLAALGARVTVVTPSRARHQREAADAAAIGIRVLEGDLRDRDAMAAAVAGQDVVFNLAGQSGAVRSMEEPWTDLDVNCRGNLVLLDVLRATESRARLVFVGSRLEYGQALAERVDEEHATDPLCIHGIHKLTVEKYLRLYGRLFGLRYAIARVTNPYGPGQPFERASYGVVNRMIQLALAGETLPIYGDGTQRRDYIYVDEVVEALIALGASEQANGRIYNVGTGVGTRLVDLARTIIDIAGGGRIEFVPWPTLAEKIETGDFVADVSRIRRDLGWTPAVTLEEGLRRTVRSYARSATA